MHARGRSRDIAPLAIAAPRCPDGLLFAPCHPATPRARAPPPGQPAQPRPRACAVPPHARASSARTGLSPPCSHSHASTASTSTSSEPTPAPATPPELAADTWASPPSPPPAHTTLTDQLHIAYAHENFHLAKILLLRLKGIEVTSDADPRIAEVTDADFATAFVPRGRFKLDAEAARRCEEGQRRERERLARRAREERLRVCERVWERSVRCLREEKARVARRKEEEGRIRRRAEIEAREREREARERERERELLRYPRNVRASRAVLSYGALPAATSRSPHTSTSRSPPKPSMRDDDFEHTYALMPPVSPSALAPARPRPAHNSPNRAFRELAALDTAHVPFADVLRSMHGSLFPADDGERSRAPLQQRDKRSKVQVELLEELCVSPWDVGVAGSASTSAGSSASASSVVRVGEDGKLKLKAEAAAAASASTSTSSLSVSVLSRSMSWFSFGSRASSKASVSTLATSPSTSPAPSKVLQTFLPPTVDEKPALRPRTGTLTSTAHPAPPLKHTLVPVLVPMHEDPLAPARSAPYPYASVPASKDTDALSTARGRPRTRRLSHSSTASASSTSTVIHGTSPAAYGSGMVHRLGQRVSSFLDAAAQLHRAYVRATMAGAGPEVYFPEYSSRAYSRSSSSGSRSRSRTVTPTRVRGHGAALRAEGYRACAEDVLAFTAPLASVSPPSSSSTSSPAAGTSPSEPRIERTLIPLLPTPSASSAARPSTPRVFPLPPPIPRSPFRLAHPPARLTSRLRPVANPLLLRLRALENLYGAGLGDAGEGKAREKVVGVAWEGIGRSGLGREVKVRVGAVGAGYGYQYGVQGQQGRRVRF